MSRKLALMLLVVLAMPPPATAAEEAAGTFESSFPVALDGSAASAVDLSTLYLYGESTSSVAPKGAISSPLVNVTVVTVDANTVSAQGNDLIAVPEGQDSTRVQYYEFDSALLSFDGLTWSHQYETVPGIQVLFFPTPSAIGVPSFGLDATGGQYLTLLKQFRVLDPQRNPDATASTSRPNDWEYALSGPILSHTGHGDVSVGGDVTAYVFGATFSVRSGQQLSTFATGKFVEDGPVQKMTRSWAFVRLDSASGTLSTESLTASLMNIEIHTSVDGTATLNRATGTIESTSLLYRADSPQQVKVEGAFEMRSRATGTDGGTIGVSGRFDHVSLASMAKTVEPVGPGVPTNTVLVGVAAIGLLGSAAYLGAKRGVFAGVGMRRFSLRNRSADASQPPLDDGLDSQEFVFASEVRALVYELVEKRAGLTKPQIVAVLGKPSVGTELDLLVAKGLVLRRSAGGAERYFFPMRQVEENFECIATLRDEKAGRVAELVLLYGIIPARELEVASRTASPRVSPGDTKRILHRLERLGLVRLLDESGETMVEPTLALQECLELMGSPIPEARIRDFSS